MTVAECYEDQRAHGYIVTREQWHWDYLHGTYKGHPVQHPDGRITGLDT